jgi:predicted nuclease of predicted toxin-antitoxin system
VKLLFDQNLSPRLVGRLADLLPNSNHVFPLGLDSAEDSEIWEFARKNDFVLVTKDADFGDMSILRGFPPQVIWIRRGNCRTSDIEQILRDNFTTIEQFETDLTLGFITLF